MIALWATAVAPAGYLICDGSAVSRAVYAALFTAIGVLWGAGDGSTTFNLPDLRDRVAIGASPGSLTGRPTARTIASNGGEESHTLTVPELPSHGHSYQATTTGSYTDISSSASGTSVVGSLYSSAQTTGNTGGGGAHNNMQPFAVLNYIIKT
jgi:microcystin-dependent protein